MDGISTCMIDHSKYRMVDELQLIIIKLQCIGGSCDVKNYYRFPNATDSP